MQISSTKQTAQLLWADNYCHTKYTKQSTIKQGKPSRQSEVDLFLFAEPTNHKCWQTQMQMH